MSLLFMTLGKNEAPIPITTKNVVLLGDSTITSQQCRSQTIAATMFSEQEKAQGWSATNLAVGGATINNQLSTWNNYANKLSHDVIIVQVGLNDMNTDSATTLNNYQNLVNQINATKKVDAELYISCMLPCKQRWIDLGLANGQSNWVALNNAIMTTITGVTKRNDYHVALLDDGNGNLAAQYDCGDHIHENQAGADIIAEGFRIMLGL